MNKKHLTDFSCLLSSYYFKIWGLKIRNSRLFLTPNFFYPDCRVGRILRAKKIYSTIWIKKLGGQKISLDSLFSDSIYSAVFFPSVVSSER